MSEIPEGMIPTDEEIREAIDEKELEEELAFDPNKVSLSGQIDNEDDWYVGRARWELWVDGRQIDSGIAGTGGAYAAYAEVPPDVDTPNVEITVKLPNQGLEKTREIDTREPVEVNFSSADRSKVEDPDVQATELTTAEHNPEVGDPVRIRVFGQNMGDGPAAGVSIPVKVDGEEIGDAVVTALSGEEFDQKVEWRPSSPGTHTIEAAGMTHTVDVRPASGGGGSNLDVFADSSAMVLYGLLAFGAVWWWSNR